MSIEWASIQWGAVAGIGILLTAITAAITLGIGGRRWRIALQTDLLLKYYDKFYSPQMHQLRKIAAEKLLRRESPNYELEDVLDYFGIIGALLEKKVLDYKITRGLFDWWVLRYWCCAREYIKSRREDRDDPDSEMWWYLERMANKLTTYRDRKGLSVICDSALRRFLREESHSLGTVRAEVVKAGQQQES